MHENFSYYLERYSPAYPSAGLSPQQMARVREVYPPSLAEFICTYGFLSFHNGLFTLCDPNTLRPLLAMIFKDDKDFNAKTCHVVGYTAFGVLHCWSDRHASFQIELPLGVVYCRALTVANWNPKASADHLASGIVPDAEDADFLDAAGEPMFARCVEAYGHPGMAYDHTGVGECYGFVPALAIGGAFGPLRRVENIKRMSALEHFTLLAQLQPFYLVHPGREDIVPIRRIG